MTDTVGTLLVLLALLQVKHMFADYYLQTPKMLSGRGTYLHTGRAQHAAVHAVGSAIVLLLVGTGGLLTLALVATEWLAHFHIDWAKARYSDKRCLDPSQAGFWRAAGFDQALHQLTYVAMLWGWVVWSG